MTGLMEQLVAIIKDLCGHGPFELKVQIAPSPFRQVAFQLPRPKGPPFSLRSLDSVQCLQELFLKCSTEDLARSVLLALNELCVWDDANYFLMDYSLSTLSSITAKVSTTYEELLSSFFL